MQKIVLLLVVGFFIFINSCSRGNREDKNFVVASLNGNKITLSQLDDSLGNAVYNAKKQIYDTRQRMLDEMIGELLLEDEAKKRNVSLEQLKKEVSSGAEPIKDEELDRFYDMAQKRDSNITKETIRDYLQDRQRVIEERKFIAELKSKAKIENFLNKLEPKMPRLKVNVGNSPFKGPENAKVTIVEFTTYFCGYCGRAQSIVDQVMREYAGKVRLVKKYFLLSNQDNVFLPHLATKCANDQGKYWEYSELVWQDTSKMDDEQLKKYAKDLNLDTKKFNECLDTKKYKADIEKESNEGRTLGVTGTPAFFINGLLLSGARPFESFKEIIDKEL